MSPIPLPPDEPDRLAALEGYAVLDRSQLEMVLGAPLAEAAELAGELIDLFFQEGPVTMAALERALAAGDCGAAESLAHTLKGACGNLGLPALGARCRALEDLAAAQDRGGLAAAVGALIDVYRDTVAALALLRVELSRTASGE